ncbi:hypothetical protein [Haliangium sp.]|uniref:hypothetical protein n=1 Tax=Haliangium sp. TaxID=2663208 RepID=UPI003D12211D
MAIDIGEFLRTQRYQRSARPAEIVADVASLGTVDKLNEGRARTWGIFATTFWVLMVFCGFFGLMIPPLLVGAIFFLVGGIVTTVMKRRHKGVDLIDRRYQLIDRLARLVEADMASDSTLDIDADLGNPARSDKLAREGEAGHWKVKYYVDSWLSMQGRFMDGTSFAISMVHHLQKRTRWKRSSSGKLKHKSKEKAKNVAVVQLRAKPQKYPRLPTLAGALTQAVQLPHQARLLMTHIDGHRMTMKVSVNDNWCEDPEGPRGSEVIAMMLLSLYQVLNLAKAIDKRDSAA